MKDRLTRKKDMYECRIAGGCPAEDWIEKVTGVSFYEWEGEDDRCDTCPFEKYINRLAEYEDEDECMEDDGK